MENIYKIKIKTNPDPRDVYPSERRYSASTVLGLSVVHICLAVTAILMASLAIRNVQTNNLNVVETIVKNTAVNTSVGDDMVEIEQLEKTNVTIESSDNLIENIIVENSTEERMEANEVSNLCIVPWMLSFGGVISGVSGLIAWKKWYIDNNIKWFFIMSTISTGTSLVALILILVTIISLNKSLILSPKYDLKKTPNVRMVLAINILITGILEFIWSCLSTKISYRGMKNTYPDDIIISKSRGKIEVNTVYKGNKKGKVTPPDILNHFNAPSKFTKYLPKKESGDLPKAESNSEYQERVRKFLASEVDNV